MSLFDKICACLAIPVGAVFMVLGIFGLFAGSRAHFTLPPVLGGLPFFLGWAMCVTLIKCWLRDNNRQKDVVENGKTLREAYLKKSRVVNGLKRRLRTLEMSGRGESPTTDISGDTTVDYDPPETGESPINDDEVM